MKLCDERYEEIKNIVVNLLVALDIRCVPISGFEIAVKLGIKLIPYSAKERQNAERAKKIAEDGVCIEMKDGSLYIFYNDDKDYNRLNWTILHEIGHLVLGHTEHCKLADAEADFFAKNAIAPPILVHKLNLKSSTEIQDHFYISKKAAENSWNYYQTWLRIPGYKQYEVKLCTLFGYSLYEGGVQYGQKKHRLI